MTNETLYPHEMLKKYWDKYAFEILSILMFICAGMAFGIAIYINSIIGYLWAVVLVIFGLYYKGVI